MEGEGGGGRGREGKGEGGHVKWLWKGGWVKGGETMGRGRRGLGVGAQGIIVNQRARVHTSMPHVSVHGRQEWEGKLATFYFSGRHQNA